MERLEFKRPALKFCTGDIVSTEHLKKYFTQELIIELIDSGYLLETKRPPLGLVPIEIHHLERLDNINEAIKRYDMAGMEIPIKWIAEKQSLESFTKEPLKEEVSEEDEIKISSEVCCGNCDYFSKSIKNSLTFCQLKKTSVVADGYCLSYCDLNK